MTVARVWPLPALGDPEGEYIPRAAAGVVDAHVHLFPDAVFERLWTWFDEKGWPIRYRLSSERVITFLEQRGVERIVALHYAHKPGLARSLNSYVAGVAAEHPAVRAVATVYPGEPEARHILEEAAELGLFGVKIHCHVQRVAPDSERLDPVYDFCSRRGWPVVLHAGREPRGAPYGCDPDEFCAAARVERVLSAYPRLKLCVPHFGADEFEAYARLLERHDRLWVDTAMILAEYLPVSFPASLMLRRPERVMYGTDFPNLPYAWDRELKKLLAHALPDAALEQVLYRSAEGFFELPPARRVRLT